jgi:glycosyltransferase involved in cell wall biosynthesis
VDSPKKLAEYFQACDLYLHTADAETFGLAVCEAMACGASVVATNAGGIPELVRDGETGCTVPIGDDERMVAHILDLMVNRERLKRMGHRAAQIARDEYGLERMVDDYIQLYQELILEHNK